MTEQSSTSDRLSRTISLISLGLLAALLLFLAGVYFANKKLWPYKPVRQTWSLLMDAWEQGGFAPQHVVNPVPAAASRETWLAHDDEALMPGYRGVTGYLSDAGQYGVWLFDPSGQKVHERALNYAALDPDGPSAGSEAPHAFLFLADGSVIVNTDKGDAIARYDVCGEPVWFREGAFHHSLAVDPQGGVWTWQGEKSTFDQYQALVRFDPDTGETLERIDLFADIIDASVESRTIFSLVPGQELEHFRGLRAVPDFFHPNDLEVLTPDRADAFPAFEAGDFLMSFRNLDLITVVDRQTLEVKWYSHGPWRRQHDPEFTEDGRISVFNNNPNRLSSNIVTVDPGTRQLDILDIDEDFRFFTQFMGKQEQLDNGNYQITVPYEGRVLEVSSDGRVLLEINNVWNQDNNAFISDSAFLPTDFFDEDPVSFSCES